VRNNDQNEDEDGKANMRDGKTNYFIFPGESGQDPAFLIGEDFRSTTTLTFTSEGNTYTTPPFTAMPHSHDDDDRQDTTAAKRFGITTFVYAQRRPFVTKRFETLLVDMPWQRLPKNIPWALEPPTPEENANRNMDGPFSALVRSKGFMWLSTENEYALYWSQAGQQIEIAEMGQWWASVDRAKWPEPYANTIQNDFSGQWGDRRQELIFIGANMDQDAITKRLDACLATDDEMRELEEAAAPKELVTEV
jgi:G3E family GTPase